MRRKIAVVGGGAAGMMAAIQAASAGAAVDLYERNERVGKKLLATGNGKCNFSNKEMYRDAYYGSARSFYESLFPKFGVSETIDFFAQNGMLIKEKNGYLYPASEQAATVLDILRYTLDKHQVNILADSKVEAVLPDFKKGGLKLRSRGTVSVSYDAVILACGGMAAPKSGSDGNGYKLAKSLGHHITKVVPALVQLRCMGDFRKIAAGVRTQARLSLLIDGVTASCVQGELQMTDYGISGIPVFQFSREASYAVLAGKNVMVSIHFLPQIQDRDYAKFWQERWERQAGQNLEQFLTGISNKKINQLILKSAGVKPFTSVQGLSPDIRSRIEELYRNFTVSVYAANGFEQAQVSAGGIAAGELTDDLESKYVPHLYFAGEIIDIDGICGGYNLQWAWTSGAIAGRAAAQEEKG